jgi:hypothetical protein
MATYEFKTSANVTIKFTVTITESAPGVPGALVVKGASPADVDKLCAIDRSSNPT